jgi:hypothetical protein
LAQFIFIIVFISEVGEPFEITDHALEICSLIIEFDPPSARAANKFQGDPEQ